MIERETRFCKDEITTLNQLDGYRDLASLPSISTDDVIAGLKDATCLANAFGDASPLNDGLTEVENPKKQCKKSAKGDQENKIVGSAGLNEDEMISDSGKNDSAVSSDSDEIQGEAHSYPKPISTPPKNSIRDHLLLLAQHPCQFLHHFPQTSTTPERWTINFTALIKDVTHSTIMQTITSRYGVLATRLTRILLEQGKVGEKELCQASLLNQKTMRSHLSLLHRAGMISLQEMPRDNSRNPQRTIYLWFFNVERCKVKLLDETYKSMARSLQRAKIEGEKYKGTVDKASRSDVIGNEERFLSMQEREALSTWRAIKERIWGELGRLDDVIAVFRDY